MSLNGSHHDALLLVLRQPAGRSRDDHLFQAARSFHGTAETARRGSSPRSRPLAAIVQTQNVTRTAGSDEERPGNRAKDRCCKRPRPTRSCRPRRCPEIGPRTISSRSKKRVEGQIGDALGTKLRGFSRSLASRKRRFALRCFTIGWMSRKRAQNAPRIRVSASASTAHSSRPGSTISDPAFGHSPNTAKNHYDDHDIVGQNAINVSDERA